MIYNRIVRRRAPAAWKLLREQHIDDLPLANDVHFIFEGDHPLAADVHGAEPMRAWLRELFRRLPGLYFEVEDVIVEGGPWSTRIATRYAAMRDGEVVYRGAQFARLVWGKLAEERILPDTQALVAALQSSR